MNDVEKVIENKLAYVAYLRRYQKYLYEKYKEPSKRLAKEAIKKLDNSVKELTMERNLSRRMNVNIVVIPGCGIYLHDVINETFESINSITTFKDIKNKREYHNLKKDYEIAPMLKSKEKALEITEKYEAYIQDERNILFTIQVNDRPYVICETAKEMEDTYKNIMDFIMKNQDVKTYQLLNQEE